MLIKKKIKKAKRQLEGRLAGKAEDFIHQLSERWKLKERMEQANRWAEAHRKQTVVLTIGALILSILLNVLLSLSTTKQEDSPVGSIENVQPMFTGLQQIQNTKDYHLRQMNDLALRGQHIKEELDSLVHLPMKTHQDSLLIISKYKQLEMIVENLKRQ